MELAKLLDRLPAGTPPTERLLVEHAHEFAALQHAGQMRASGHPYIQHCMAVAEILAGLNLPAAAIAAALLHDVVEDTSTTVADLQREFNPEIARLVDGVTKLTQQVARVDKAGAPEPAAASPGAITAQRADTIRKTFLAMGDDVRIMLIKLADRLHNMRTLAHLPAAKRQRIAQETLDIFAPLANRLGIWQFKWELEDLGMRHTNPARYKELAAALQMGHGDRERVMGEIVKRMERELQLQGITADVTGRPKHLYSIWRKMERKEVTFEKVFDVRALRVVVHSAAAEAGEDEKAHERREKLAIANCYVVLGLAHQIWKPIPGEFDDYIATPKDNFYRSLHTAVVYDDGKTLEVQIRTREMDQNADLGIAAHWRYKEGNRKLDKSFDQRVEWLRSMMDWRSAVTDGPEFVDALKSDLFPDRVLIFTPRGDIIDLPAGATPIDFAYHVHTSVGERCRGSKVNGKLVPLNYALHTGERVEILTAKRGGPSRDWLNVELGYVASARAREKIRTYFKLQDRDNNVVAGRHMLDHELKRLNLAGVSLDELATEFNFEKADDLLAAIGCHDLSSHTVINHVVRQLRAGQTDEARLLPPPDSTRHGAPVETTAVSVLGTGGLLTRLASCCSPLPGDDIVGYTTRTRGISIHRGDCPNVLATREPERLLACSWGHEAARSYPVPLRIVAFDRAGLMRDIATRVANEHASIKAFDMQPDQGHVVLMQMTIDVSNLAQLRKVLTGIEQVPNVTEVHRIKPGKI